MTHKKNQKHICFVDHYIIDWWIDSRVFILIGNWFHFEFANQFHLTYHPMFVHC